MKEIKVYITLVISCHYYFLVNLLVCRDIQERYRTLVMYDQPVTSEEQQWCAELQTQWLELAAKARQRDRDIIPDKRRFTVVSTQQIQT